VLTHSLEFNLPSKQGWRGHNLSLLNRANCSVLVDNGKEMNLPYKWLEAMGQHGHSFTELLKTGRILERQLLGVDLHPEAHQQSIANVKECQLKFPEATFYAKDWADVCSSYKGDDVGYVIYDLYSSKGSNFDIHFDATLSLLERSKEAIGEVFFVVNLDLGSDKHWRGGNTKKLAAYMKGLFQRSYIKEFKELSIEEKSIYLYRNEKVHATEMASIAMVL
jgi:hypothetical protein